MVNSQSIFPYWSHSIIQTSCLVFVWLNGIPSSCDVTIYMYINLDETKLILQLGKNNTERDRLYRKFNEH